MAILVIMIFLMGLLALIFDYFDVFVNIAPWWSIGVMAIAYIMLTRISEKEKAAEKEKLVEQIQEFHALFKF